MKILLDAVCLGMVKLPVVQDCEGGLPVYVEQIERNGGDRCNNLHRIAELSDWGEGEEDAMSGEDKFVT